MASELELLARTSDPQEVLARAEVLYETLGDKADPAEEIAEMLVLAAWSLRFAVTGQIDGLDDEGKPYISDEVRTCAREIWRQVLEMVGQEVRDGE